jgi:biopolymer transport protein TolQ
MDTELSFLRLMGNATFFVQGIMLLLLAASLLSWAIIFTRYQVITGAFKALRSLEQRLSGRLEWERLLNYLSTKRESCSTIEHIYRTGLKEFIYLPQQPGMTKAMVLDGTRAVMQNALTREEGVLAKHLDFLATVGSLSVYVGLLGTVWGIMNAFRGLGSVQQATLAMVAPGISEALIATAMGLCVAIPANYAYNHFSHRVGELMQSYDLWIDSFYQVLSQRLQAEGKDDTSENRQNVL